MGPFGRTPVLWHIPASHFSEKVRWALDWKGVAHERHAPPPPASMAVAWGLTRGTTLPVLQLDGRAIGDSTAIIAALEARFPAPPLLPDAPAAQARALALEEHFDEGLGPAVRHAAFHWMRRDPVGLAEFAGELLPGPLQRSAVVRRIAGAGAGRFTQLRYGVGDDDAARAARTTVLAALHRLEEELMAGDGEHLVGGAFSVADLTAAALLVGIVRPPKGPHYPAAPAPLAAWIDELRPRPAFAWVEQTYARYR